MIRLAASGLLAILLILLGTLGTMRIGWWNPSYDEVAALQAGPPSQFIMVGATRLHVRDEGSGPVLIMLHSSMTNLREWDDWADRLKVHYRVIRFDWPPYGLSIDPEPTRGMPGIVDLLERFAAQQRLDHFTLIGSSSGAAICVLYAAMHPSQVDALALSTLPLNAPPPTQFSTIMKSLQWVHTTVTPGYYPRFYYRMALQDLYGEPTRLRPSTIEWYADTNNLPGGFARVRAYLAANRVAVWSKGANREAAMIRAPILLQWGDRDPVLAAPLAAIAKAEFANAPVTLIHYPDVGHYPMLELPEKTGEDLEAFLDRLHGKPTLTLGEAH